MSDSCSLLEVASHRSIAPYLIKDIECAERRNTTGRDSQAQSGDTVHKERGDAIHLQPYKKPALLPGDHEKRVGCGLLTLSHAILSR